MATTFKQRLTAGLQAGGFRPGSTLGGKHELWVNPALPGLKLYLGTNGGLRQGRCVTESRSIGCPSSWQGALYKQLLLAGDAIISCRSGK